MKNRIYLVFVAMCVCAGLLVFMVNRSIVMPIQKKYELSEDSLSLYLGRQVVIDSVTHTLVSMSVISEKYTTDKGVVLDFAFVNNYFNDTTTVPVDTTIKGNE